MLAIIGIHSSATGEGIEKTVNLEGHAWLSLHYSNGKSTTVGLWTTALHRGSLNPSSPAKLETKVFIKDPFGILLDETFDVEFGKEIDPKNEKKYKAKASRFYALTENHRAKFINAFTANSSWRFSNTCATWATYVIKEIFGEEIKSEQLGGVTNTPWALARAIKDLEKSKKTSLEAPL